MPKKAEKSETDTAVSPPTPSTGDDVAAVAREVNEALQAKEPYLHKTQIEVVDDDTKELEPNTEIPASDMEVDKTKSDQEETSPTTELTDERTLATVDSEITEDGISDDPVIVQAIDDIVAEEGDVVLEAEDQTRDLEAGVQEEEPKKRSWLLRFFGNSKTRWSLFIIILAAAGAISYMPKSRYYVLNNFGVRASVSVSIIDELTSQPLKNVSVRVANSSGLTDQDGKVVLNQVRLGPAKLLIEKRAFATIERDYTVGWGSNPIGELEAKAVGAQYAFTVIDSLSARPIKDAEVSSGEGNAISDSEGKVVLTLDTATLDDTAQVTIDFSAVSYRAEAVKINVNNKESQSVELVPLRKHVYISKRSGTYDVYAAHIDGKNEKKLVQGTGLERDDIALVPHQKDEVAALVASRENVRSSDGYLLNTLYILNTKDGNLVKIDQSDQIQIIGWDAQGHLVYVKIAAGASGTDPKRHRLMSFNYKDYSDVKELASSNSFNDVVMANNRVFYAQSDVFSEKTVAALHGINPDGSDKKTLLSKEVNTIVRSTYESLELKVGKSWYRYILGSVGGAVPIPAPDKKTSRIFADNPTRAVSLWRDSRDGGKGVLLTYDKAIKSDTVLTTRSGLNLPFYWLNDKYAVFRVNDGTETADYIMNIDGGEPRKIADVTDSAGIGNWVYY
ncbi:MAG: DUF5050 domain-containing protein [bacterium]|nr:DUF5050 domain-containing protein [bacterium]